MSTPKEPQFFAADICGHQRRITTLPEYLACFETGDRLAIGEASTCYLGSPGAPSAIREFCPQARIIIMLRNPIDVMRAEHSERLVGGAEHIVEFETALDSSHLRRYRSGPFKGQRVMRLSYRELVLFSQQVKRFVETFGRPNVHTIVYDDFARNASRVCEDVLKFLDVSTNYTCAVKVVNANRRVRSAMILDLMRYPPKTIQELVRTLLPWSVRQGITGYLNNLNLQFVARPSLDQEFTKRLELEYVEEVRQLGKLIDRDLSNWISNSSINSDRTLLAATTEIPTRNGATDE